MPVHPGPCQRCVLVAGRPPAPVRQSQRGHTHIHSFTHTHTLAQQGVYLLWQKGLNNLKRARGDRQAVVGGRDLGRARSQRAQMRHIDIKRQFGDLEQRRAPGRCADALPQLRGPRPIQLHSHRVGAPTARVRACFPRPATHTTHPKTCTAHRTSSPSTKQVCARDKSPASAHP